MKTYKHVNPMPTYKELIAYQIFGGFNFDCHFIQDCKAFIRDMKNPEEQRKMILGKMWNAIHLNDIVKSERRVREHSVVV